MKEFFVGMVVILLLILFSAIGVFLLPVIVVMGFFLKWIVGVALILFMIWCIGKATLYAIDYLRKKE